MKQPGGVISWSEAQGAYSCGTVTSYTGLRVKAASHHRMSVSNVLRRHFERVEGARGLYVLKASVSNPDWDEDADALQAFHDMFGSDEFGMSTRPCPMEYLAWATQRQYARMSGIGSDWEEASVSVIGGDFDGARGRTT